MQSGFAVSLEPAELSKPPDHNGVSPFEVAYSGLFVFGVCSAALDAVRVWFSKDSNGQPASTESKILLVVLILALIFQYFRMYYYLHKFEQKGSPLIGALKGPSRFIDRLVRLLLALTLILAEHEHIRSHLLHGKGFLRPLVEWTFKYVGIVADLPPIPQDAVALITSYSLALLLAFWLLIIWDINICCFHHRHNQTDTCRLSLRRFYYVPQDATLNTYFSTTKFLERSAGWFTALVLVTVTTSPSYLLLSIAVATFVCFAVIAVFKSADPFSDVILTPFEVLRNYFKQHFKG